MEHSKWIGFDAFDELIAHALEEPPVALETREEFEDKLVFGLQQAVAIGGMTQEEMDECLASYAETRDYQPGVHNGEHTAN